MGTNWNVNPYFDDYTAEKNFQRILFKPGYAVQARELTQLQTILQEQIRRFGNHIFKEGSVVYGCAESFNFDFPYVKILDNLVSGGTIADLTTYKGQIIEGVTSKVKAVIKDVADGVETDPVNLKTLFVQYISSGGTGGDAGTIKEFVADEMLKISGTNTFTVAGASKDPVGSASFFSIDDGIIYVDGTFVLHTKQTVLLDRYSTTPSKKVGFTLDTGVVTHIDDSTLLDPAQGSYNFAAPGADRLKLTTLLEARELAAADDPNFFLLFEVEEGVTRRKYNKTTYAELRKELARRTYDESGNYTVRPFSVIIREHLKSGSNGGKYESGDGGDANKLAVGVESGKAYVMGYEYETFTTEYIDVLKGVDTQKVTGQNVSTSYGGYIIVDNVVGPWSLNTGQIINLMDTVTASDGSGQYSDYAIPGNVIGTARVRALHYIAGTGAIGTSTAKYRLYLYDINFTGDPANWKAIHQATTPKAYANVVLNSGSAVVYDQKRERLLFSLPYKAVKTLHPNGAPDIDYVYNKVMTATMTAGVFSLGLSGETWPFTEITTEIAEKIVVCATQDLSLGVIQNGQILDFTGKITFNSSTSLTFNLGTADNGTVQVIVPVKRVANASHRTKVKKTQVIKINTQTHTATDVGPWTLGVADVYSLKNVWVADNTKSFTNDPANSADWTDLTSEFSLTQNAKDSHYGHSYISHTGSTSLTNKKIIVEFEWFDHGTGSFFSVDSYPINDSTPSANEIRTYEIPKYTTADGVVFDLRNTLDFRPTITATVTPINLSAVAENATALNPATTTSMSTSGLAEPNTFEVLETDLEFYLGRIDKVILTESGDFTSIKGMASSDPVAPNDLPNAMTIALLSIPPFPSLSTAVARIANKPEDEVKVKLVDNRRYTMADIGEIARRMSRLEYHTRLTGLEQEVINTPIVSKTTGQNRFKNGILVDSFTGHNIGNVLSSEHRCAVDPVAGEMRPAFLIDSIKLNQHSLTGLVATGDLVTLPFTHKVYSRNLFASKPRNCVSALLFTYEGQISLDPPQDVWTDTTVVPDVQVNIDGNADNWQAIADAWGTQWGSWETFWGGIRETSVDQRDGERVTTEITSEVQRRVGMAVDVQSESVTQRLGNRVISAAIVPFMRSIDVTFSAKNLKPGTRVYPFFDNEDVSAHCTPDGGALGDPIITDSNGSVSGTFTIPSATFRTGNKAFILTDDTLNRPSWSTTYAVEIFSASGLQTVEQGTILSTRIPRFTTREVVDTRRQEVERQVTVESAVDPTRNQFPAIDPLAQTFVIANNPGGLFITKLDVFFRTKSTTAPVTVQIREVVNGYPTGRTVPFGTATLMPDDVDVSEDASVATTFTFDTPVYLRGDTEYCFVILPTGNSTDYNVWVSELGQFDVSSGNRISEQADTGVLFVSANDRTWTALQSEDIKYTLYQADFDISGSGVAQFKNETVVDDVLINAVSPLLTALDFVSTELDWEYQIYTSAGIAPSTWSPILTNDTQELSGEYAVIGGAGIADGSMRFKATLSSSVKNLSPAIDLKKLSCIVTSNKVTNDQSTTSKYVSRVLPLELEAEDLQVMLSQKLVGGSSILVYAKVQSALDSRNFDDMPWVKLVTDQVVLRGGYSNYTYVMPAYSAATPTVPGLNTDGVLTYSAGAVPMLGFNKFAIKIVFLSANTWETPKIKDLKAVALMA